MKLVAYEAANSFVKVKSDYGEEVYPNTSRLVDINIEEDVFGDYQGNLFKVGDDFYEVGSRSAGMSSSGGRDIDRYKSSKFLVESLAAIAKHVENGDEVKVVTGIPAAHWKDADANESISDALCGEHTVYVGDEPRTFSIEHVKVLLQPLGTLMQYIYNEDGSVKREKDKTSRKLIVDIGWGTTDVSEVDGLDIRRVLPINRSMIDAYTEIIKSQRTIHGVNNPLQLERLLREEGDVFTSGGVEYNLKNEKDRIFRHTAESIMSDIRNNGISIRDYDKVIFTGGGVESLAPYLEDQLGNVNASRVKDSQLANVRGFHIYGKKKL